MENRFDFSNHLFRCSEINNLLIKPKLKKDVLSETTISYLKKIHVEKINNRNKGLSNKYVEKGIIVENVSMSLYTSVTKQWIEKNNKRYSNDFIVGTPDGVSNKIKDIKSSWDLNTFPMYDEKIKNNLYKSQLNGYMELTGLDKSELIYCLVDAPSYLIDNEISKLNYKYFIYDSYGNIEDKHIPLIVETIKNMIFTTKGLIEYCNSSTSIKLSWFDNFEEIPEYLRIRVFEHQKDKDFTKILYPKIKLCRDYLNGLSEQIAKLVPVGAFETLNIS